MMEPEIPEASNDPGGRAAWWFTRMHSGDVTESERQAFEAWRRADPEHDRQYRNISYFWDATLKAPHAQLRAILDKTEPAPRTAQSARRRFAFGLGLAACAMALVAGVVGPQWWFASASYTAEFATQQGERRQVTMPDGSVLDLNTATSAKVRLYANRREVELLAGEIMFAVKSDAQRPFTIDAGLGRVTVTGTRFDVRRDPDRLNVAVESGSVEVAAGPWWNRKIERLTAGLGVAIDPYKGLAPVTRVSVSMMTAWRRGKIVLDNMPLGQVVTEMNRYLSRPLRLDDARLAQLRIAGVFSIDDPESMLDALPKIAPVRVDRLSDGRAIIVAR